MKGHELEGTTINADSRIVNRFLAAEKVIEPIEVDCYQRHFGIKRIKGEKLSTLLFSTMYDNKYEYSLELHVTMREQL